MGRKIEKRTSLDFRATKEDNGFSGYAASFWNVDSYGTAMAPGAFKKTIQERSSKIPVLWNHNTDIPVGKHLELREDDKGLFVNIGIADDGAEGTTLLKRLRFGVPIGMSFGFATIRDRSANDDDPIDMSTAPAWVMENGRRDVRVITEVQYWESSPVTFPANENSTIDAIRSAYLEEQAEFLNSLLEDLRSGGLKLEDARLPMLQSVVDAYKERAAAGDFTSTTAPVPDARLRNLYAEYQLLVATS